MLPDLTCVEGLMGGKRFFGGPYPNLSTTIWCEFQDPGWGKGLLAWGSQRLMPLAKGRAY